MTAREDFEAAGFYGVANNLDAIVGVVGAPAALAALVTLAGTFGPQLVAAAATALAGYADRPQTSEE